MRNGVESIQQVGNSKALKQQAYCLNALRFVPTHDLLTSTLFFAKHLFLRVSA